MIRSWLSISRGTAIDGGNWNRWKWLLLGWVITMLMVFVF